MYIYVYICIHIYEYVCIGLTREKKTHTHSLSCFFQPTVVPLFSRTKARARATTKAGENI